MKLFHRHIWHKKERIIAQPRVMKMSNFNGSAKDLIRLTYGMTTIISECEICHKIITNEIMGVSYSTGR